VSDWDQSDLEARVGHVLDIAKTVIDRFGDAGYADETSSALSFGPDKPLAETAMLIHIASGCAQCPAIISRTRDLAERIAPLVRSERALVDIALHPALVFKFAVPHVLLTRLGYPDARVDTLLRSCANSQASNGHDRPGVAWTERRWISSLWLGDEFDPTAHSVPRGTLLDSPIDILGSLRDDAYAFTHMIFYCTDFGFRKCRLPRPRSVILEETDSLVARYLDAEDYDLAAELLLSWPLTGATWSASAAFGFRVLAGLEKQAGILPCGNLSARRLAEADGEQRTRYALGTAYHTAYVMGLLCAASLQPGKAPPTTIRGRRFDIASLRAVQGFLLDDQGHWQAEFDQLSEAEQLALTPLVLDIAIMQACRTHDYERLKDLLQLAFEHRIAKSPMCMQAVELLERLAICSTAIAARRASVDGGVLSREKGGLEGPEQKLTRSIMPAAGPL
jgi:hypothetical protein